MEDTLGDAETLTPVTSGYAVLILVLMEDTLGDDSQIKK